MTISAGSASGSTGLAGRFRTAIDSLFSAFTRDFSAGSVGDKGLQAQADAIVAALNTDKVDLGTQINGSQLVSPFLIQTNQYNAAPIFKFADAAGAIKTFIWTGGRPGIAWNLFWNDTTWEYDAAQTAGVLDFNYNSGGKFRARIATAGSAGGTVADSSLLLRGAFEQEPWTNATLTPASLWVNFAAPDATAAYRMDSCGNVWIKGSISGGTTIAGTVIFNIPAAYRPSEHRHFVVQGLDGAGNRVSTYLSMRTNGDLIIMGNAFANFMALDISYSL